MRRLLLSLGAGLLTCTLGWSQAAKQGGGLPHIPFGQTYKQFQFPVYQKGQLSYTFTAASATGVTINRADALDVKIDIYTDNKVTTTVTSPDADIYVDERKMRTKNTVKIDRADLQATSQVCDFDLLGKQYLLRQNVRVILKNFDVGSSAKGTTPAKTAAGTPAAATSVPAEQPMLPAAPASVAPGESMLDVPGATASTNTGPIAPPPPAMP